MGVGGRGHFQSSYPLVTIEPWPVELETRKWQSIRTTVVANLEEDVTLAGLR